MSDENEDIERRLSELGRATASIRARPDFGARVMRAIAAEQGGVWSELVASSRRLFPVAFLLAVVAVGWAIQAESAADEALAISYDALEVEF